MATYCVEMPDADFLRVINAIAANYNRPETVPNPDYNGENSATIENPETKAQFTNRIVRGFLSENVTAYERRLALQQAEQGLDTSITIIDPQL
jgi:hypothetical protein